MSTAAKVTAQVNLAQQPSSGAVSPVGAPIVGFWHVKFTSKGTGFIPDGTVVDMGFSQWHSDGTEILNSSRPPATSNFCLGVWAKTGPSTYKLNHFALSSDLNGNMIGPANIREDVTLDAHGTNYSGTFSIRQYDTSGNLLVQIVGEVKATRITADTKLVERGFSRGNNRGPITKKEFVWIASAVSMDGMFTITVIVYTEVVYSS